MLKLRFILFSICTLVKRERRVCVDCGAKHRRLNADCTFQAFCSEECFNRTMRARRVDDLYHSEVPL